jgi:PleD family two-component response regulator
MQRIYRELGVRPLVANGESRLLSFSSGVITAQAGDRPQDLMARADEALYAAKEAGRGRCEARE